MVGAGRALMTREQIRVGPTLRVSHQRSSLVSEFASMVTSHQYQRGEHEAENTEEAAGGRQLVTRSRAFMLTGANDGDISQPHAAGFVTRRLRCLSDCGLSRAQ